MKKKLLLVDGYSLFIRSFIGLMRHDFKSPDGSLTTYGVFGAYNALCYFIKEYEPTHVLVTLDHGRSKKRLEIDPSYKANRDKKHGEDKTAIDIAFTFEFKPQLSAFMELCKASRLQTVRRKDTEADDFIANICIQYEEFFDDIIIVSSTMICNN